MEPAELSRTLICPGCSSIERQVKSGRTGVGTQRYRCQLCGLYYTPAPKPRGYPAEVKLQAVKLYLEGNNFRRIGRLLNVNHQSVVNWVNAYHQRLPAKEDLSQERTATIELDELFTFVGKKKNKPTSSPP